MNKLKLGVMLTLAASAAHADIFGFNEPDAAATPSVVRSNRPAVDSAQIMFRNIDSIPVQGDMVYLEVPDLPQFFPIARDALKAGGYKVLEAPSEDVPKLMLTAEYSAAGRFYEGAVRVRQTDVRKMLAQTPTVERGTVTPLNLGGGGRPTSLAFVGQDIAVNTQALQLSGGNLAGGLGIQAALALLFDVTGLTDKIQGTGSDNRPSDVGISTSQQSLLTLTYTTPMGRVHTSRVEAILKTEGAPLAPAELTEAAIKHAFGR